MKQLVLISFLFSSLAYGDDASINPVANKIKSDVLKTLKGKGFDDYEGFCDLMLEMRHHKSYTKVHRIKTIGDAKLCKVAKRAVPSKQYRFVNHEKFIRIQISL